MTITSTGRVRVDVGIAHVKCACKGSHTTTTVWLFLSERTPREERQLLALQTIVALKPLVPQGILLRAIYLDPSTTVVYAHHQQLELAKVSWCGVCRRAHYQLGEVREKDIAAQCNKSWRAYIQRPLRAELGIA